MWPFKRKEQPQTVEEQPQAVEEKPRERKLNISEPVWSILKAIEERPNSFSVKQLSTSTEHQRKYTLTIRDRKTGLTYVKTATVSAIRGSYPRHHTEFPFKLTTDERKALTKAFEKRAEERKYRYGQIQRERVGKLYV